MSQPELLAKVVDALVDLNIPYMLVGSLASSFQGNPRQTFDYDILVNMSLDDGSKLCERFKSPRYYLDPEAVKSGILLRAEFNLGDTQTGFKIDFWPLRDAPYDHTAFRRRVPEQVFKALRLISAPKDTILSKLRWAKQAGGSERQKLDVLKVYEVQFSRLDHSYMRKWAQELGLESELQQLQAVAKPLKRLNADT